MKAVSWIPRAVAISLVLGAVSPVSTPAHAAGAKDRADERPKPPAGTMQAAELQWQLQAQKRLESMGFAEWSPVEARPSAHGAADPSSDFELQRGRQGPFRARLVAPALAFLHGISDAAGGLPEFGGVLFAELQPGGSVALRTSIMGELADPSGRSTGLWVYDPSRLPERVQAVRSSLGSSR